MRALLALAITGCAAGPPRLAVTPALERHCLVRSQESTLADGTRIVMNGASADNCGKPELTIVVEDPGDRGLVIRQIQVVRGRADGGRDGTVVELADGDRSRVPSHGRWRWVMRIAMDDGPFEVALVAEDRQRSRLVLRAWSTSRTLFTGER